MGPVRGAILVLPILALLPTAAPAFAQTAPGEAPSGAPSASGSAPPQGEPVSTPAEALPEFEAAVLQPHGPPRIDLGIAELRQELDRAERAGDVAAQAKALGGLGTLYMLHGRNVEALAALNGAATLYERLGNTAKQAELQVLIDMVRARRR